jgi:hypothetical protein
MAAFSRMPRVLPWFWLHFGRTGGSSVTGVKGFRTVRRHTVLRSRGYTNMRISGFFLAILTGCFAAAATAETVYKWVDGAGQVHYTDLPPSRTDAKIIGIYEQESGIVEEGDFGDSGEGGEEGDTGEPSEQGADEANPAATPPSPPEPPISQQAMAESRADAERVKAEQCKEAQARYKSYTESRRLFRPLPNGEREYLTDKELEEARARAKQTVTDYCS